jgi:membrane-associated protease RseP (regulator of RpoE activity)
MSVAPREQSPWPAVLLLVGLVALMVWRVGWVLPVVLLSIVVMVAGHEFGHFATAKRAGMLVTDFFVGFGPVLWSRQIGETRYGIRAFLLGGYVKVPGMTWRDDVERSLETRTYRSASYPKKVLFASAGSLMHLVMALVLAWASLTFVGAPSPTHVGVAAIEHWDGVRENPAQQSGLRTGDRIVAVDGIEVTSPTALVNFVHAHAGQVIALRLERGSRFFTISVTPVDGRTVHVGGQPLASGTSPVGFLGIALNEMNATANPFAAVGHSFHVVATTLRQGVSGIVHVFSPAEFTSLFHQVASTKAATNPQNQVNRPESIVGIVRIAVQGTQTSGVGVLLNLLVSVNIFVGLMNMLPLLPLDGGYVAFATYERLRSRRGMRYRADINKMLPVVYAFVSVLAVLFACTLYLDIAHPITNPF